MTARKIKKTDKQIGYVDLRNLNTTDDNAAMRVAGTAAVYEKPTVLWECDGVEFKEVIERGAFNNADFSDCCLKYNHVDNIPILARVRGGSLTLNVDDIGLHFDAKLFNTSVARDVYELVREKGLDKCSFAFTVTEDEYDRATHTRRIKAIGKVFDVSIVDIPAYDDTDVSVRSKFLEAEAEKEHLELLESNNIRKRAILKTYL